MKFKNIVQIITLTPLSIYFLYCICHFLANEIIPTYSDCGIVVSKSNDETPIRHGTRTELYLNVQFKESGFKSIACTPTTYFHKKIGDNVCFDLNKKVSSWYQINFCIGFLLVSIFGIIAFGCFISYLIPDSWFENW